MSCTKEILTMVITEADAKIRIGKYNTIRAACLDNLLSGKLEISIISYEITGFLELMDLMITKAGAVTGGGIRIYLGAYTLTGHKENDDKVPKDMVGNLTLIFAITTVNENNEISDTKEYFILPPSILPAIPAPLPYVSHIPMTNNRKVVAGWVRSYQENKLPSLSTHLQRPDTKSLWYNSADFLLMINEMKCQMKPPAPELPKNFTHVNISFSTFDDNKWLENCKLPGGVIARFFVGGQMSLIITPVVLTDQKTYETFYLQRRPDNKIADDDDYDTGIPIPPAGGGGEGLP